MKKFWVGKHRGVSFNFAVHYNSPLNFHVEKFETILNNALSLTQTLRFAFRRNIFCCTNLIYVQSANNFFAALDDADEAKSKVAASSSSSAAKKPSNSGSKVTAANKSAPPSSNKGKGGRGGGNGDRNTKFGRSGRGPAREGKREYDRRSGTGRGKETKKGGGGARNWGSDKNEAKKLEGTIDEDRIGEETVADGQEPAADVEAVEPVQDNTMTLAEYMASKNAGKSEETTREVENEFSGKAAAVKKEEEDFFSAGGKKKRVKKKKEEEKKTVDVGFRVVRLIYCRVYVCGRVCRGHSCPA